MTARPLPSLLALALPLALGGGCAPSGAPTAEGCFLDVTSELGLPAPDGPPEDGAYYLPEMMQGGVGFFDYDNDGDLDILHVRAPLPGGDGRTVANHLYRQEANGAFVEVSGEAGLGDVEGFGQGMSLGDVDNDGDTDVYITNYGPDEFYLNDGDGTFTRATSEAGFSGARWSTASSFVDYDADGYLDLFVAHYVHLDPEKKCFDPRDRREYCGPWSYVGRADKLYRNNGDGTFEDVTEAAGIVLPEKGARATGLGVLATDFTGDGRPDIYVANDLQSNQLWVNRGDGTFSEEGILRGVAADPFGHPEASMGVAAGDANCDGIMDIFMTHLWQENNRLFLGGKGALFADNSVKSELSKHDWERTGWGCGFFDFDNDGDMDIAVSNGGVRRRPPLEGAPSGMWSEYAEPNQLFENTDGRKYSPADGKAGTFALEIEVSRGLALGDYDEDGDVDILISNIDNTLRLYRNDAPREGMHRITVRALEHGRDAVGAQVRVTAGGRDFAAPILPSSSYLSSNDPRAHIGLGAIATIDTLVVCWIDGTTESFGAPAVDQVVTVEKGKGVVQ